MEEDDEPILVETRAQRQERLRTENQAQGFAALALGILVLLPSVCAVDLVVRIVGLDAKWYHVWPASFALTILLSFGVGRMVGGDERKKMRVFYLLGLGTLAVGLVLYFGLGSSWMFQAIKRLAFW